MDLHYVIAGLVAILTFLTLYAFLMPKSSRRFTPGTQEALEDNELLKFFSVLGDDIYAALPVTFDKRKKEVKNPKIASLLRRSGNPWGITVDEFYSFQFIAGFLGFLVSIPLAFWFIEPLAGIPWYVTIVAITVFSFFIPLIKHRDFAASRDLQFRRELPEALDLLTISISGGMTLDSALKSVIPNLADGIVKTEFIAMTKMLNTGSTMHEALEEFAKRAPSDGVLTFIRAVQSALKANSPMAEVLEARAAASREEFFSLVEQKAAQLESMMLLYLIPTLLPALLIIIVAPSIISFMGLL